MSEVQQPVVDPAAAPTVQPAAVAETPATTTAAEGTTATTDLPKEEKVAKGEVKIEAQPVTEGILNYKGPGLKGLIFSKKYFWLSEEPLEHSSLTTYLSGEKNKEIAHSNAAHATQTGKGLLFFAKRQEDKGHPQGILNLAEVTDIAKGGATDFTAVFHGNKHLFQALNRVERDGWLVSIHPDTTDFKSHRETLVASSGFKSALEKLTKPATGATASHKKEKSKSRERVKEVVGKATGKDSAKEEPKELAKETPAEGVTSTPVGATTAEPAVAPVAAAPVTTDKVETPLETKTEPVSHSKADEIAAVGATTGAATAGTAAVTRKDSSEDEKTKNKKSRSQSRGGKRGSIFGGLLGKKDDAEEKKAAKKEEKKEEKAVKKEEKKEEKAIKQEEKEIKSEEKAVKQEEKKEEKAEKQAEKLEKKAEKEEHKSEKATEKAAKQEEKASEAAAAAAAAAATATAAAKEKDSKAARIPTEGAKDTAPTSTTKDKANKRGSVFGGLFNKKETTKPAVEETAPAVPAKEESAVSPTAPQLDNPVTSTTEPTIETPAPVVAETGAATTPVVDSVAPTKQAMAPTDKRRTSLFGGIGSKKEKRTTTASGDELTDGESKKPSGGFGNLLRKASRAQPKDKPSTAAAPAVPTTKPAEPTEVPLPQETAAETEVPATTANGETIGDKAQKVADTVTGDAAPTTAGPTTEVPKTVETTA